MTEPPPSFKYFNWPQPQETIVPYVAPPKGSNPVVRGTLLVLGAPLVTKLGFAAQYLYNNAGFDELRKIDVLEDVEHRMDPTVIPLKTAADEAEVPKYTDPGALRRVEYGG